MPKALLVLGLAAVLALFGQPRPVAAATDVSEQQELMPSQPSPDHYAGWCTEMSGDTIVATAVNNNVFLDDPYYANGLAYVYRLTGGIWLEEAILEPSDGYLGQLFGGQWPDCAAIAGDTVVISATMDSDAGPFTGAAYVFERTGTTWTETAKLMASDPQSYASFGYGVSITEDANTIVVGAPNDDPGGAVYVFGRDGAGWVEQAKLLASDADSGDAFGTLPKIASATLLVPATGDDESGPENGALYIFGLVEGEWVEQAKLMHTDGNPEERLGYATAISPDQNLVAASVVNNSANIDGAVYLFERTGSGWVQQDKLLQPPGPSDWPMGDDLVLTSDTLVVGHTGADSVTGATYIFRRSGGSWSYTHRLLASDGAVGENEAIAVARSGGYIAVGGPWHGEVHNEPGVYSGAVFVYRDPYWDADSDGEPNDSDNCPATSNADQADDDGDGEGNACDPTADAGGPYLLALGASISLSGLGSADPDGIIESYDWAPGTHLDDPSLVGPSYTGSAVGVELLTLTVSDDSGNTDAAETMVVTYDPNGGFVTGGGWIHSPAGAYVADPGLTGKATFGFVAKYKPGADVPEGNTEFQFKAGNLNFQASSYDWLVVAGQDKAKIKGSGTINGAGSHKFMLTALDNGSSGDKFHIKIWDDDGVVYDNFATSADAAYDGTVLGGGSIRIHRN